MCLHPEKICSALRMQTCYFDEFSLTFTYFPLLLILFFTACRIIERGAYTEKDASKVIRQVLEAVAVSTITHL